MEHTPSEWRYTEELDANMSMIDNGEAIICGLPNPIPNELYDAELKEMRANARLISAAPDLYEACEAQHNAIDLLFARLIELDPNFFPSKSGLPWEAVLQGNKAIAKVEGK